MHHLIIGAGPAGVVAAEHIRKLDKNCSITIVGDEPEPPYSRMAIPYFLIGNIAEEGTYLRKTDNWFTSQGIDVKNATVNRVNPGEKQVVLNDGEAMGYDKLLVCTGSHPIVPPISGMDLPQVHNCWKLEDARAIVNFLDENAKVVLMGAGFIGCIILEALALRKVQLTVIEMENRMVPRMMNETTGGMIKSWCINKGINVLTSTRVADVKKAKSGFFKKAKHPLLVELDSGDTLDADLVITATGVRSNFDFLKDSGVELDQGIKVDEFMRTSDPDIYAAGDVAQAKDFSTEIHDVQAIQPTAVEHGKLAATNMVKDNAVSHKGSVNMNVLDTLGLISTSFGMWMGVDGGDSAEISDVKNYKYINLQFKDDVLVGASSLGMTQHMGVIRGLIQTETHLGIWKEKLKKDPTRIMEAYLAMAQSQSVASKL